MQKDSEKIIQEYEQQCELYSDFTEKIEKLIRDLLKEKSIKVHSIPSRLKNSDSIKKKLDRAEGTYSKLSDVTDISGIRIITYFADDVDLVAKVIEEEFDIDRENSVDKRALLDPDRFGYISLHYVAKVPNSRLKLTEYRRFSSCKVEIQVRSILQHTWAEIEHDLGYKTKDSVPRDIRRRFSRLAGLLEIADSEFIQIRDDLQAYEKAVPKTIIDTPESVLIDQASIKAFIKNSTQLHEFDQRIATIVEAVIYESQNEAYGLFLMKGFKHFGIETIADIESAIYEFGDLSVQLAGKWLSKPRSKLMAGISLFYLFYILAARNKSAKEVLDYSKKVGINLKPKSPEKIVSIYTQISSKIKS